jgi:DNA-binding NarL/FixJ family response regulator
MPLLDGIDVLKEMRAHDCFHKTKVVMYSTFMDEGHIEECQKLGVHDCLKKSSVFLDLCTVLRKTIGKDFTH